jgi:hypothetical protein
MIRLFLAVPCILVFASIGAFFLFVPPLAIAIGWIAIMALLLTGFTVLYRLGVRAELQPAPTVASTDPTD